MREYIFRAKREKNGYWIDGGYFSYRDFKGEEICTVVHNGYANDIIPDTVGMFTGKQLNGERLFQDDIVEWYEDVDDSWGYTKEVHGYSLVVWDEENFCWAFMSDDGKKTPFNDWTWENCQIAGNIHDHPDLFEVKI